MRRQLIIDLETSALTPEVGDIIRFRAENVANPEDAFDEWAMPPRMLSADAEKIIGTTNDRLARCRPLRDVFRDFLDFIEGAEILGDRLDFELAFLKAATSALSEAINYK